MLRIKFQTSILSMSYRIFIAILCLTVGFGFCVQADLNDDLISAWTFDDGTANDAVNNNDGEINGAEVVDGKFSKALDFNGEDAFVRIPHDPSMETIVDGLTVSAWIFIRSFPQPNHAAVVFKGQKIGWSQDYAFRIATRDVNQLTWAVPKPGAEGNFNTDNSANAEEWTFVCLTADGSMLKGYTATEGGGLTEVGSTAQAAPYQARVDEPVEIGVGRARGGTIGNDIFFDGIIDEVYLWGGRALPEDEIELLASGERPSLAILSVEASGKLATLWGRIKQ